jgi:hypothetical protein
MKIQSINFNGKDISSQETNLSPLQISAAKPRTSGRTYTATNRPACARYIYNLLLENEYAAHSITGPKDDEQLKKQIMNRFRYDKSVIRRFMTAKVSVSHYRLLFNENVIIADQPPTPLLSFSYAYNSHPTIGGHYKNAYIAFEECVLLCLHYKKADPRYIPYEQILDIRTRQINNEKEWLDWIVPKDAYIELLKQKFGVDELYNCVQFNEGLTREETPIDFKPHVAVQKLLDRPPNRANKLFKRD